MVPGATAANLPMVWREGFPYGNTDGAQMHREVVAELAADPSNDIIAANNADFPDDLVVKNSSKVIIASGAGMQNQGSVSVIGLGNDLFGGTGDGTMEVDPGGLFTGDALIIGDGTAANGLVAIDGALEFVIAAPETGDGFVTIGQTGTGTLDITGTPNVFTKGAILGLNQGSVGTTRCIGVCAPPPERPWHDRYCVTYRLAAALEHPHFIS
jgi:hypothetical protein